MHRIERPAPGRPPPRSIARSGCNARGRDRPGAGVAGRAAAPGPRQRLDYAAGIRPFRAPLPVSVTPLSVQTESAEPLELSIVMPCLNEADTLGGVHPQGPATRSTEHSIRGEIIVADNGSTDGSQRDRHVARRAGRSRSPNADTATRSRAASRPRAAGTSSWATPTTATTSSRSPKFVEKLREGYDLVQGCRLPSGGGRSCPARCRARIAGSATRCSR